MNIEQMIDVCSRVILTCVAATAIDNRWCVFPEQGKKKTKKKEIYPCSKKKGDLSLLQ